MTRIQQNGKNKNFSIDGFYIVLFYFKFHLFSLVLIYVLLLIFKFYPGIGVGLIIF